MVHPASDAICAGNLSLELKRPRPEPDHWPPSGADSKNESNIIFTLPSAFMICTQTTHQGIQTGLGGLTYLTRALWPVILTIHSRTVPKWRIRGTASPLSTCLHDVVFNRNGGRLTFTFSTETYVRTNLFLTILKNINSHLYAPAVLSSMK